MTTLTNQQQNPIGIIDSGIGGFTVARWAQQLLPGENLVYLGDGANTPYGNHTGDEILEMNRHMLGFMKSRNVKALLVACNTTSCLIETAHACGQTTVFDEMPFPVFSMLQAGVASVKDLPVQTIGIISTVFTHNSGCYPDLIKRAAPEKTVISHGCPNLVAVIEQHLTDPDGQELIDNELRHDLEALVHDAKIDCCVFGCTHYPLVSEHMTRLYPSLLQVDPARQMAELARERLAQENLLQDRASGGLLEIFTTGTNIDIYERHARVAGLLPTAPVGYYPPAGR